VHDFRSTLAKTMHVNNGRFLIRSCVSDPKAFMKLRRLYHHIAQRSIAITAKRTWIDIDHGFYFSLKNRATRSNTRSNI